MDEFPTQSFFLNLIDGDLSLKVEAVVSLMKPGAAPQFEIQKYLMDGSEVDLIKNFGLTLESMRSFEKRVIDEALEFWDYEIPESEKDDIDIWEYDE